MSFPSNQAILERVCQATGAGSAHPEGRIQSLWSGYGEIIRVRLVGASVPSVVVKSVAPPTQADHPRGWNTDLSHQRKLQSYAVEMAWYQQWSARCDDACRVPHCFAADPLDGGWLFVLEDLDDSGFGDRRSLLSTGEVGHCLQWLAAFHATFLGEAPAGLWPIGTYWHLDTRPDEWAAIADESLREAAPHIDQRLTEARFQTLVHGDAKVANFCFTPSGDAVAAVDFQYVGGGCGMKDVAYFLGSCLTSEACEWEAGTFLDLYFSALHSALAKHRPSIDAAALEAEWRALYPWAWADFYRFLAGWSPQHWKMDQYSQRLTNAVLEGLSDKPSTSDG